MSGNGTSYQKGGNYAPIPIEQGDAISDVPPRGNWRKIFSVGVVLLVAALAAAVGTYLTHKKPGAATDAAVQKANLPKSKSGKLKLFDAHSKSDESELLSS